ncbi:MULTISPECIES: CCA tRNA nucleotidyltransferase [Prochlorococcus]|uniref:tRNA nucleotidyltransferase/poly(A) polymerase n=1 Tax=Prochlorococcus marinus (strain SARG / CCMP1375 / SS120) TaxID=167539 RepID=Q7TVB1_PROMA|nr:MULTISPECIES: CCA tRNA nucleotidyltransferase [Prochlorococcus]KGG18524.1 tRNA nucleotidyltransferase [Prochlorococcus marinus str. SS2]KGG22797.1 tRNA nucleotidyltransferase [Prochlorococcus marinus str. SS35]AAP99210.1 tRNA nucleotidyltransferase/poly(A) polymerase [Prochlorococcus marinus subsp. marinus str. CCMP1375]KGG11522.1 tRNA nucleotidyltransferase [Prochlorococcus marinus str. LG]KGG32674.1 tRNA nucleotidyltransferase [Prochlorococcus marinus str. SS51]
MHISFSSEDQNSIKGNGSFLAKELLGSLQPEIWPFLLEDLPIGTVLVGGAIRDRLLNNYNSIPDLDFVVPKHAFQISKDLAKRYGGTAVHLDQHRDIARYVINDWKIDIASQIGKDLNDDLLRRDFTINAIALNIFPTPAFIDPAGGLDDLHNKKLVAISEQNFIDDPLRILRGLRLVSELNLKLESQTESLLKKNAGLLNRVASERIKVELERLVQGPWANDVIPLVIKMGLLRPWSLSNNEEYFHSLSLKNVSSFTAKELKIALPLVRLSNLLSVEGLVKLGFSKKTIKSCNLLKNWQKRNDGLSFRGLNEVDRLQLHIDLENHLPALILMLQTIDQKIWLERWRDLSDPLFHPSSPIDGNTLKDTFDAPEGPWIGALIHFLSKERAFGRLRNREEAFELARYWWEHNKPFCD